MTFLSELLDKNLPGIYDDETLELINDYYKIITIEKPIRDELFRLIPLHGKISQKELCEQLNTSPSAISRYISEFELVGLIKREHIVVSSKNHYTDDYDRRVVCVELTKNGRHIREVFLK